MPTPSTQRQQTTTSQPSETPQPKTALPTPPITADAVTAATVTAMQTQIIGTDQDDLSATLNRLQQRFSELNLGNNAIITASDLKKFTETEQRFIISRLTGQTITNEQGQIDPEKLQQVNISILQNNEPFRRAVARFQWNNRHAGLGHGNQGINAVADGLLGQKTFYAILFGTDQAEALREQHGGVLDEVAQRQVSQLTAIEITEPLDLGIADITADVNGNIFLTVNADNMSCQDLAQAVARALGLKYDNIPEKDLLKAFTRFFEWYNNTINQQTSLRKDMQLELPEKEILELFTHAFASPRFATTLTLNGKLAPEAITAAKNRAGKKLTDMLKGSGLQLTQAFTKDQARDLILFQGIQENAGEPASVSYSGAIGNMQFLLPTAIEQARTALRLAQEGSLTLSKKAITNLKNLAALAAQIKEKPFDELTREANKYIQKYTIDSSAYPGAKKLDLAAFQAASDIPEWIITAVSCLVPSEPSPDSVSVQEETGYALGIAYMDSLLTNEGNILLALAAYNAGPGNVNGFIPNNGQTPEYVSNIFSEFYNKYKDDTDFQARMTEQGLVNLDGPVTLAARDEQYGYNLYVNGTRSFKGDLGRMGTDALSKALLRQISQLQSKIYIGGGTGDPRKDDCFTSPLELWQRAGIVLEDMNPNLNSVENVTDNHGGDVETVHKSKIANLQSGTIIHGPSMNTGGKSGHFGILLHTNEGPMVFHNWGNMSLTPLANFLQYGDTFTTFSIPPEKFNTTPSNGTILSLT